MQAHDSGPRWCATPFLCGSLIRYSLPVYPGACLTHSIRSCQHIRRNRQADLLGGFQVDNELKFLRLLHRQVGSLGAFQNLVYIGGGPAIQVGIAHAVEHEPPVFHIFWPVVYRRESALYREVCNLSSLRNKDFIRQYEECVSALLACGLESNLDIFGSLYF